MIKDNIKDVNNRIRAACKKSGRAPDEITLVSVTKGIDPYRINEVFVHGVKDIGENRVQEALKKKDKVMPGMRWHFIGHLQSNKVKDAIRIFDLIHSVDSLELAGKVEREAKRLGKIAEILIQVNTSGEKTKYGIKPEDAAGFLRGLSILGNVKVSGLMTVAPLAENPETVRPYYRKLREIFDGIRHEAIPNIEMKYLSMGMSQDFDIAIQEGANIIRIGTAIFSE